MGITQIGNGDFPLNNCAILRQILPESSLDFMKTVLRGEAFANPIADLAGNVRGGIADALSKIGTLSSAGGAPSYFSEMSSTLTAFQTTIIDFESRTNRMSGLITGYQDGEPDMGRILGLGSAYNSALATLVTDPEELLKDNFSHGFNSLKQEFGVNAIQESNSALEAAGNFLAQFGLSDTDPPGGASFIDPNPFGFYGEAQEILGSIRTIQQSITNITNAEDAYLAGALAFLDQFALANTALSSVLADPCMAGKVIKDLVASPDLTNLIPSLELPSLPTIDDVLSQIPDPQDVADAIGESVEGIAESVREQVEGIIESTVEIGRETAEAIQKSAEDIIEAGEQVVKQAEQAAKDLATNVEEYGKDVETFFEDLEKEVEEATSEEDQETQETPEPYVREPRRWTNEEEDGYVETKELWLLGIQNRSGPTSFDLMQEGIKNYMNKYPSVKWSPLSDTDVIKAIDNLLNAITEKSPTRIQAERNSQFEGDLQRLKSLYEARVKEREEEEERQREAEREERRKAEEEERKRLDALAETRNITETYSGEEFGLDQNITFDGKIDLTVKRAPLDRLAKYSSSGLMQGRIILADGTDMGGVFENATSGGETVERAYDLVVRKLIARLPSIIADKT